VLRDAERPGFDLQGSVGRRQRFCRQRVERLVRHDLVALRAEHAGKGGAPRALLRNDEQVLLRRVVAALALLPPRPRQVRGCPLGSLEEVPRHGNEPLDDPVNDPADDSHSRGRADRHDAGPVDRRAVVACREQIDGLQGSGLAESALGLLDGFDVPDGMTFVFDDGSPVEETNEFLRQAPIALSSVRKYAGGLASSWPPDSVEKDERLAVAASSSDGHQRFDCPTSIRCPSGSRM
jgi:hypothetical protein